MTDTVLWANQKFDGPFAEGLIASAPITNNNEDVACRVFINYAAFDPNPAACQLLAVLEQEVDDGVFETLAAQHEIISSSDNAPTRHIVIEPSFNANPGGDEFIAVGAGVRVSRTQGAAARSMRLALYKVGQVGTSCLNSFTVSARATTYNLS